MNPNFQHQMYDGFTNPQPTDRSEGTPFPVGKLIFGVFLLVGLALAAFYIGVIEPLVKELRKKRNETPTNPTVLKLWEEDETTKTGENLYPQEDELSRKWREKHENLGLIENSRLNGNHVGDELLNKKQKPDDEDNDKPKGEGNGEQE